MKQFLIPTMAVITVLLTITGCGLSPEATEPLTVAQARFESTALVVIAEGQGFFKQNGLDVSLSEYETGAGALDGMLAGEADIAVGTAEFPLVGKAFKEEKVSTIGSIAKSDFIYIIGRKDRGINEVRDLKGKSIGTTAGTIAEFFLGRYLDLNNMNAQDIHLVDIKTPADYGNAIVSGAVDAIASAQPNANAIKDNLGDNAVFWPAQSGQRLNSLIIATDAWVADHPEAGIRFLRALAQAEEFTINHPDEAKAIIQKRFNLDTAYMETVWSQNQFSLTLDQSLIIAMEDEARWMIKNKLTTETVVPNFLDYIDEAGLKKVRPEAVNIIR